MSATVGFINVNFKLIVIYVKLGTGGQKIRPDL